MSEYKNPIPVVVALIPAATQLISLDGAPNIKFGYIGQVRGIEPGLGGTCLPSGYINEGETAEVAIAREVKEEMGFDTSPSEWSLICTEITAQNRLLIFLAYVGQDLLSVDFKDLPRHEPNSEVSARVMVDETDELIFPLHTKVLRTIIGAMKSGL
jgi:ADP-ribose pyrophosphatase YjhB (NUDIX family)